MLNFTDLTGLAGVSVATSLLLLPGAKWLTRRQSALLLGTVFVLMLVPFGGMPLAAYVRGITGDLSITTLLLLGAAVLRPWCSCEMTDARSRRALSILIVSAALVLYPMALGIGAFDPYRLGYSDLWFIATLMLIALVASRRFALVALCIATAVLAWAVGWYESDNLWDYLLDPFVSIYALAAIMVWMTQSLLQRGLPHRSNSTLPK